MKNTTPTQKNASKTWWIFGFTLCAAILIEMGIWWVWTFKVFELHANCSDGFTIWRRNPGAFSSYILEIRDGITPIEKGLRSRDPKLNDFMKEHKCHTLEGG